MFGALAFSNQDHFRPEGFWRAFKDYDGEPINVREHQDAYEFFTRLQARPPRLSIPTSCAGFNPTVHLFHEREPVRCSSPCACTLSAPGHFKSNMLTHD